MKSKSQIKRILSRMLQMIVLLAVFIGGGILLPMYTAPSIFSALSITPLSEKPSGQVSVRITNRNAANREDVQFTASSPDSSTQITAFEYSCEINDIGLYYRTESGSYKKLPCGTEVYLPPENRLSLQVRTTRSIVGYLPVTVRVDAGSRSDAISSVIAASFTNTDHESSISEQTQVTVDNFGRPQ